MSKETYCCLGYAFLLDECQKRPTNVKTDLLMSKETY